MWLRYRRLSPRYEIWASVFAVVFAVAVTVGVCLWAIGQAP
ncbi:MAG: hypothetical protein AAGA17_13450 [Actinomycetota bacterium]